MYYGSKTDETEIVIEEYGRSRFFMGIEEIGFNERGHFIIDLWTTKNDVQRGGFCTTIPISSFDHRLKDATNTGYKLLPAGIAIANDWGHFTYIYAPQYVIDQLVQDCKNNYIPEIN